MAQREVVNRSGETGPQDKQGEAPFFRSSGDESLSVDQALSLLENEERRRLLVYLMKQTPRDVSLDSMLDELVESCGSDGLVNEKRQVSQVSLYHTHIPKLEEAGVVIFDKESEMLSYQRDATLEQLVRCIERIE